MLYTGVLYTCSPRRATYLLYTCYTTARPPSRLVYDEVDLASGGSYGHIGYQIGDLCAEIIMLKVKVFLWLRGAKVLLDEVTSAQGAGHYDCAGCGAILAHSREHF